MPYVRRIMRESPDPSVFSNTTDGGAFVTPGEIPQDYGPTTICPPHEIRHNFWFSAGSFSRFPLRLWQKRKESGDVG